MPLQGQIISLVKEIKIGVRATHWVLHIINLVVYFFVLNKFLF